MHRDSRIFVAGHRGLVGSAICRGLEARGYSNLLLRTHAELDLAERSAVRAFFDQQKPEFVFLAASWPMIPTPQISSAKTSRFKPM